MNIFEKIVAGEIPSFKVYEDEEFLAFLDIEPKERGHTLVIPKKCYKTIKDIPNDILQRLIIKVKEIATLLEDKLDAKGINIFQNNNINAGQVVPHIHFHIVPRYKDDCIKDQFPSSFKIKEGELEKILEVIKNR